MRFVLRSGIFLLAAALIGGAMIVPAAPASAATEAYELLIVPEDPLMEPADEYVFTLRIENTGEEELPAGVTQFRLFTDPVTDVDAIIGDTGSDAGSDADGEEPATAPSTEITRIDTPQLGSGEVFDVSFTVPGDELPLTETSSPGVYLTEGRWSETGFFFGTPALTGGPGAPILWMADDLTTSLELATILPVVYPAAAEPAISASEVNTQLTAGRTVENLLTTAETYGAVAAIDPKIVAYVRSLGATASASTQSIVDSITGGSIDTFALQYADADPALQTRLLKDGVLQPTGTSFLTRFYTQPEATDPETEAGAEGSVTPDTAEPTDPNPADSEPLEEVEEPTASADPTTPNLSELLTWDTDREGYAWPTPKTVTASTIRELAEQGFTSIILSGGSATGSPLLTLGGTKLFNSNEDLEHAAQDLVTANDELTETLAEARIAALTAVMGSDAEAAAPAQALLAINREVALQPGTISPVFELLSTFPWVESITIDDLDEGHVALAPAEGIEEVTTLLLPTIESEINVVEHSRVLEHPEELIDFQRDRLMSLLSVRDALVAEAHDEDAEDVAPPNLLTEAIESYLERDTELSNGVTIVDTEHTRLVGSSSRIPIQLRNTLPFDAAVTGNLQTGTAALIVEEPSIEPTVIPAETTVNHLVSVQSRVSNGSATLLVSLDDTHEGETITSHVFNITMSSDIENYVLAGLGAVALTLFGLGAWRSVKRNRGAQRSADE